MLHYLTVLALMVICFPHMLASVEKIITSSQTSFISLMVTSLPSISNPGLIDSLEPSLSCLFQSETMAMQWNAHMWETWAWTPVQPQTLE